VSEPKRLVLASSSRYRQALLAQLGVPFEAAAPDYAEEHDLPLPPEALVLELARKKAQCLRQRFPDAVIIGCDQVAALGDELLFKPGTLERAETALSRLQGKTHRLLTGLVVLDAQTGRSAEALDVQQMAMRPLTRAQIAAYVALEAPLDCAGAYRVEGPGIALFEAMSGGDYTGIIGLPLTRLVGLLMEIAPSTLPAFLKV